MTYLTVLRTDYTWFFVELGGEWPDYFALPLEDEIKVYKVIQYE